MNHYEELVKAFLEGDNKAFEAIYRATYKNVYFTCLSFLKNEKDAEDVTQDVYEAVYRNVKTLKNPENLQVWTSPQTGADSPPRCGRGTGCSCPAP